MQRTGWALAMPLAIGLLASACAATDTGIASAASPSCAAISREIAKTEEDRQHAIEEGKTAWKAVVPVAVAARYAASQAQAGAADDRLRSLQAQSGRQGC